MRTIGFYSFKGGVGRSNLLMNIAFFLAARRHRHVGILDLDLEAPGLSIAPSLGLNTGVRAASEPRDIRGYPDQGLMDFFKHGTRALKAGKDEASKIHVPDIADIFYETRLAAEYSGSVHLAPAEPSHEIEAIPSKETPRGKIYHDLTQKWSDHPGTIGEGLFRFIVERIRTTRFQVNKKYGSSSHKLDYLLCDLRTGMTELTDTSAGILFSELFMVSGLNTQNVEGLFIALHSLAKKLPPGDGPAVRVFPVFSPIPNAELLAVRKRLEEVTSRLREYKEELREQGSRLQIILPNANMDGMVINVSNLAVIHYCDYLALYDDSVLIDQFPETQTARDLVKIAEELERGVDDIKKQTAEALEEIADLKLNNCAEEPRDVVESISRETSSWQWLFDILTNPPPWHWPLDDFASTEFHVEEFIQEINAGNNGWLCNQLLDRCTISSLEASEKIMIIRSLPKLSEKQMRQQLSVLSEEQARLVKVRDHYEIAALLFKSMREWINILELLGAQLLSTPEMIARIRAGVSSASSLPSSWLLLLFIHEKTAVDVAKDITALILDADKSQRELLLFFLRSVEKCDRSVWRAVKKQILSWTKQSLLWRVPSCWLRDSALALIKIELYEPAEDFLLKAAKLTNDPSNIWFLLGILREKNLRHFARAEAAYRKSIKLDRGNASAFNNLAHLLHMHLGHYEEAEKVYRTSIALHPHNAMTLSNIGLLLSYYFARYEEAEAMYLRAIEVNPQYAYPYYNLYEMILVCRRDQEYAERLRVKIKHFVAKYLQRDRYEHISFTNAVLLAIAGEKERLASFLAVRKKQEFQYTTVMGKSWLHVLAATLDRTEEFPLEFPENQTTAGDIESTILLTATLSAAIAQPGLEKIKRQIQQTLTRFVPPPGSRNVEWRAIEPYLRYLGWEDMNDRTIG